MTTTLIDASVRRPVEGAKNRTEGHLWLHRLVGEWEVTTDWTMPDGSSAPSTSTESVRKLGEYWVVAENVGPMPDDGTEGRMIVSLGYDHRKGFVGCWIASMMDSMTTMTGRLEGDTLVMEGEAEDMEDESKTATYRDTMHWEGEEVVRTSSLLTSEGPVTFMTSRCRRVG